MSAKAREGGVLEFGRKPDYLLSALSKTTEHRGSVGAAWANDDGSISIKLNPFVVLSASADLVIRLFVNDSSWEGKKKKAEATNQPVE